VIQSLLERKIEKLPDHVRLPGRILFLTEDPALIRRQLGGEDLPWDTQNPAHNPKLRDDISTDEIMPAQSEGSAYEPPGGEVALCRQVGRDGRLSEEGPGQHNPDRSEGPWGKAARQWPLERWSTSAPRSSTQNEDTAIQVARYTKDGCKPPDAKNSRSREGR
jgi:hypothetical protein